MKNPFIKYYSLIFMLTGSLALSACGGGGGDSDDDAAASGEVGQHVYFSYHFTDSYNLVNFSADRGDVLVAANCNEQRWVEDNDGEILTEDNPNGTATVTVTNGKVDVQKTGVTELRSSDFGHCPQGIPGNGTTFSSDIRCYDDNHIVYLKVTQDNYADGEAACTDGVGGSTQP